MKLFRILRNVGGRLVGGAAPREVCWPHCKGPAPLGPMPCDPAVEAAVSPMKVWAGSKSPEDALKHALKYAKQPGGVL